jgi:response regulator RpfG family c-di-GMP phosphodiesterase
LTKKENRARTMKKVLIAHDIHVLLERSYTFLNRTDIKVFVADTNDKALKIHHTERVNLIITQLDMPGLNTEQFCSLIRDEPNLRAASMIMVCDNTPGAIEQSSRCRANSVLLRPVHPIVLMEKAQQLLDIAARENVRVLMSASVDSRSEDDSFLCRTRNMSATGMLIETNQVLAEGARIFCEFYLPNAKKIKASGKIIRAVDQVPGDEDFLYGLMFTDITSEARQQLLEYVESALLKARVSGS